MKPIIQLIHFINCLYKTFISFIVRVTAPVVKAFEFVKHKVQLETASFAAKVHALFMLPTLLRK